MTRHLHRDYHTAFCGKDASHILMAWADEEADCPECLKQAPIIRQQEEDERARAAAELAEKSAKEEEKRQRAFDEAIERAVARRAQREAMFGGAAPQ